MARLCKALRENKKQKPWARASAMSWERKKPSKHMLHWVSFQNHYWISTLRYSVMIDLSVEYILDSCLPFWTTKLYEMNNKNKKIIKRRVSQDSRATTPRILKNPQHFSAFHYRITTSSTPSPPCSTHPLRQQAHITPAITSSKFPRFGLSLWVGKRE